jgi:hypothetical protein
MDYIMSVCKWVNHLSTFYQLPIIAVISYLLGSCNTSIIVSKSIFNLHFKINSVILHRVVLKLLYTKNAKAVK